MTRKWEAMPIAVAEAVREFDRRDTVGANPAERFLTWRSLATSPLLSTDARAVAKSQAERVVLDRDEYALGASGWKLVRVGP